MNDAQHILAIIDLKESHMEAVKNLSQDYEKMTNVDLKKALAELTIKVLEMSIKVDADNRAIMDMKRKMDTDRADRGLA